MTDPKMQPIWLAGIIVGAPAIPPRALGIIALALITWSGWMHWREWRRKK